LIFKIINCIIIPFTVEMFTTLKFTENSLQKGINPRDTDENS
jgi:hypothetical protein